LRHLRELLKMRTQSGTPDKNQNARRRKIMSTIFLRAILASAVAMLGLSGTARAWDDGPCEEGNSILQGDYAFTVSGQVFLPTTTLNRQGIALTHFDGNGKFTQVDFVLASPPPPGGPIPPVGPKDSVTGFNNDEAGTYTVNPDCTGEFTINDQGYVSNTPGPTKGESVPNGVIAVKFILSDHGRGIHTMVYSLTPPGSTTPVPVLIHSDGHKLGKIED
jgi:hypothetical protein